MSLHPNAPQIDICVVSDVWSTPKNKTLLVHLEQFNRSLLQQQVELDARGCYMLVYSHIQGSVLVHVEYPGNPWSLRTSLDKEIVLPKQKTPEHRQLLEQEKNDTLLSFHQRLIMAGKGSALLAILVMAYRWRKFFVRILKRIGILRPPMPALPKELYSNTTHNGQDMRNIAMSLPTDKQACVQTPSPLSKEALRAHIIACFDAVVHACDTHNGWGKITPACFAQNIGPSLSKKNQCLLETFCQRVEQCAFDPESEPSESDVIEIHHLAQKLVRKLQVSTT